MVDLERADDYLGAAARDCRTVEILLEYIDETPESICFHCEQAAEKMLKQVFIDNGRVPERTHRLEALLDRTIESGWLSADSDEVGATLFLSAYATKFRYVTMREAEKGEALQAVASCNAIADMLSRQGYRSVSIRTSAGFLHDAQPAKQTQASTKKPPSSGEGPSLGAKSEGGIAER